MLWAEKRGWRKVGAGKRKRLEQYPHLLGVDQPRCARSDRFGLRRGGALKQSIVPLAKAELEQELALRHRAVGLQSECARLALEIGEIDMLLEAVGEVIWIDDEALLDAATAVSGSGPAYVFLLAECLTEAGVAEGLDREFAARLARATIAGAGELLRRSDLSPAELRKNVTSPKGVTAEALEVLMGKDGLSDLLKRAVAAAAKRSRELSS